MPFIGKSEALVELKENNQIWRVKVILSDTNLESA
jgi:hypothetical protein